MVLFVYMYLRTTCESLAMHIVKIYTYLWRTIGVYKHTHTQLPVSLPDSPLENNHLPPPRPTHLTLTTTFQTTPPYSQSQSPHSPDSHSRDHPVSVHTSPMWYSDAIRGGHGRAGQSIAWPPLRLLLLIVLSKKSVLLNGLTAWIHFNTYISLVPAAWSIIVVTSSSVCYAIELAMQIAICTWFNGPSCLWWLCVQ